MVIPANNIVFKIGPVSGHTLNIIKDVETFEILYDGIDEWNLTNKATKSIIISLSGKRNNGEPGNDYVADLVYKIGNEATARLSVEFPSGCALEMNCVVIVNSYIDELGFECLSEGRPEYRGITI